MTTPQDDRQIDSEITDAMPTGAEVHDALMAPIDEDLTTKSLPTLDEKYKDESQEDRNQRVERYKKALESYDKAFTDWVTGVDGKVDQYRQHVLSNAEAKSGEVDEGEMSRLESEISNHEE